MNQTTRVHLYGYLGIVVALATSNWASWLALLGAAPVVLVGVADLLDRGQTQKERIERLEERLPAADGGHDDGN